MNVLSDRDRRVVLWLITAAVCWRWLLAARTPLPSVDACHDLWLAARLAGGDFAALGAQWWAPIWALLLTPAQVLGCSAWLAAQVGAAVVGGLALLPLAVASERRRAGTGVAAASLLMVGPGLAVAAGRADDGNLTALLVAIGVARWCAGSRRAGLLWLLPVCGMLVEAFRGAGLRTAAWVEFAGVLEPVAALLLAACFARVPARGRELALCACIAPACYVAWHSVEPAAAAIERWLGRHIGRQLQVGEHLISDRSRVVWAAGMQPESVTDAAQVLAAAARPEVAWLVLGEPLASNPSLSAALAGTFARHQPPNDVVELMAERGLMAMIRR